MFKRAHILFLPKLRDSCIFVCDFYWLEVGGPKLEKVIVTQNQNLMAVGGYFKHGHTSPDEAD